ncbi:ComEA family DNA-binding protein [Rhizobacter fulvus]|jgi:competence protein ComEA
MIKKILAAVLALFAAAAFAAVDANKATQAELEGVKGIGPAISARIIEERNKGAFKDWQDMVTRVKGVGEGNAAKFSTEGLTVNGTAFAGAPAKPATPAAKPAAPVAASAAAPAAAAKPTEMSAADKKAAAKKEREEKKAAKAAAAEEAKKAKADKAAAKDAKKPAAAASAAASASAAKK